MVPSGLSTAQSLRTGIFIAKELLSREPGLFSVRSWICSSAIFKENVLSKVKGDFIKMKLSLEKLSAVRCRGRALFASSHLRSMVTGGKLLMLPRSSMSILDKRNAISGHSLLL